ncbi:hypothetical protein BJF83_05975 [Nocardiopsis sp. CNR-923]|uniref:DUF418 domain-containing protein n=1 Tax=Nocardiopsis sp. CNR-923 TaxID=1904965 RepID=UPI00095A16C6|nr:DUF418 domain-containing protein [Nocardiopsis sp. CNR-923]OLT25010.1 hypothetical protein BJF83_05975 [Nocardiopsis sp. CNR-923]
MTHPRSATTGGTAPASERELAPDLARGAMLLLIAMAYAGVYAGVSFGAAAERTSPLDDAARFLTVLVLDNRAFSMFAILYGYGMGWLVARQLNAGKGEREARRLMRRRSLYLLLFGSVHAFLVFPGEILASYGLAGLALGWLLFRPDRAITRAVAILTPVYAVTVTLGMFAVASSEQGEASGQWGLPGYTTAEDWVSRLSGVPFTPLFIAFAYPLLLLVALGFWAGRRKLLDDPAAHRVLLTRVAVVGTAASVLGALPAALVTVGVLSPGPVSTGLLLALQVLTGVFGGAGYAAVFGLLGLRFGDRRGPIVRAVAAVGQRSLTFYLANSVLVAVILHPDLGGLGARVGAFGALCTAFAVWLLAVCVAAWMDRTGRRGPVDALLRALVYRGAAK